MAEDQATGIRHAEELALTASFVKDLFAALRKAEAAREREAKAAVCIQAHSRGYLLRSYLGQLRRHATIIQKCWRGYRGREHYKDCRQAYDIILRARFFTAAATRIQRTWRGWFSRKHRHDFYKRQSYLEGVRHANAVVRKLTAQQADLSWREEHKVRASQQQAQYNAKMSKSHHMLSTCVRQGVYGRRPQRISQEIIQQELQQPYGDRPPPTWHWGPQERHPALLDWGDDPPMLTFDGTHCIPSPLRWTERHILDLATRHLKLQHIQEPKDTPLSPRQGIKALDQQMDMSWHEALKVLGAGEDPPPPTMRMSDAFGRAQLLERLALKLDGKVTTKQHGDSTYRPVFHSQDLFQPAEETLAATERWNDPRLLGKPLEAKRADAPNSKEKLRHPFTLALHPKILFDEGLLV